MSLVSQLNLAFTRVATEFKTLRADTGYLHPTGSIIMWGGTVAPAGWQICNGTAISRTVNAALFGVLSTSYGVGDGSTTFNVPNFTDRFPYGVGVHGGRGVQGGSATDVLPTHVHTMAHTHVLPDHTHSLSVTNNATQTGVGSRVNSPNTGNPNTNPNTGASSSSGTGGTTSSPTIDTIPPYTTVLFIIKT